ncbi:hypothetical protein TCAL_16041 [Tigriopus californicus]|uniref:Uncharacterized protein n=1 Tax=Tigriopus californicus TaxID=6832 RepID=A0A553PNS2_TIGCA|nr:hypothetical protein TCAL_16041 [Tigriopus californicus]
MSFIRWIQRKRRSREENVLEQKSRRSKSVDVSQVSHVNGTKGSNLTADELLRLQRSPQIKSEAIQIPTINLQACGSIGDQSGGDSELDSDPYRRHSLGYMSNSVQNSASGSRSSTPPNEDLDGRDAYRGRRLTPSPHQGLYSQYCAHLSADYGSNTSFSVTWRRHSDTCQVPVITVVQSQERSNDVSQTSNGHSRRHSVGILPNKIGVGALNERSKRGHGKENVSGDRHSILTPELKESFLGVKGSGCFASQGSFTIEDAVKMYEASQRRHSDYGTTEPHAQLVI